VELDGADGAAGSCGHPLGYGISGAIYHRSAAPCPAGIQSCRYGIVAPAQCV